MSRGGPATPAQTELMIWAEYNPLFRWRGLSPLYSAAYSIDTLNEYAKSNKAMLENGMTPILCCGETLEEREGEATRGKVTGQIHAGIEALTSEQVASMVLAYEPIWAIGTGRTASAEDAQQVCSWIRAKVKDMKGTDAAKAVRIQYGGSVKAGNAAELMGQPDIDGALVGGAALDPEEFARIVQFRLS